MTSSKMTINPTLDSAVTDLFFKVVHFGLEPLSKRFCSLLVNCVPRAAEISSTIPIPDTILAENGDRSILAMDGGAMQTYGMFGMVTSEIF